MKIDSYQSVRCQKCGRKNIEVIHEGEKVCRGWICPCGYVNILIEKYNTK